MDILPSGNIFRELQVVHDTGYLSAQTSLEDHWEQVNYLFCFFLLRQFFKGFRFLLWGFIWEQFGFFLLAVTRNELQLPHYNGSVGRVDLLTLHVGAPNCLLRGGVKIPILFYTEGIQFEKRIFLMAGRKRRKPRN